MSVATDASQSSMSSETPKSILNNAHEAPRQLSSGSESGFKAALKAAFLPPAQPGCLIKNKDGKPLGKSFKRTDPLAEKFKGGQVLPYDPRGEKASAGDGVIPLETLEVPQRRDSVISDSGYNSDYASSIGADSETIDTSVYSQSLQSNTSKTWSNASSTSEERGRPIYNTPSLARQASITSTSRNSSAAIRFCPLPVSGRPKRANSITIGVAARTHLLHSQGSAAPPRQYHPPQHVHGSQQWCQQSKANEDVVDVGEEIRKGALKAWKKIKGGTKEDPTTAATAAPKKQYPKEEAPVADPNTGDLKVIGGPGVDTPASPAHTDDGPNNDRYSKMVHSMIALTSLKKL